jgi:histidinol-phosphate/aromatic aminotransferase/cobyric acid decarboxylase-like protein
MQLDKPFRLYWGENYSEKPKPVQVAIKQSALESIKTINLYPAKAYDEAAELMAQSVGAGIDQVILGHGIEGLIHLTSNTFLKKGSTAGMFDPSFFVFANNINRFNAFRYPVNLTTKVNVEDLIQQLKKVDLFYIASPSTATGNYLLTRKQIIQILESCQGILVIDECYYGIGTQTVVDLVNKYPNLIVYRGITKVLGLASLRLGFAISNKNLISKMKYFQNDLELDPIGTFSLKVFKHVYPYFNELADVTRKFEEDTITFLKEKFPETEFIKNVVTYHYMSMKPFKVPTYEVMNKMTKEGYIMSGEVLKDNSSLNFPEYLEITMPPRKYWQDFAKCLRKAIT